MSETRRRAARITPEALPPGMTLEDYRAVKLLRRAIRRAMGSAGKCHACKPRIASACSTAPGMGIVNDRRWGARVVQLIVTELDLRGNGRVDDEPYRRIRQFWTMDGGLVAEVDPWKDHQRDFVVP